MLFFIVVFFLQIYDFWLIFFSFCATIFLLLGFFCLFVGLFLSGFMVLLLRVLRKGATFVASEKVLREEYV